MSVFGVKLPDVGEGVAEAELIEWYVDVGDRVTPDTVLADVMTDKATVEISSPVTGVVTFRVGEPGEVLAVGTEFVGIELDGAAPSPDAPRDEPTDESADEPSDEPPTSRRTSQRTRRWRRSTPHRPSRSDPNRLTPRRRGHRARADRPPLRRYGREPARSGSTCRRSPVPGPTGASSTPTSTADSPTRAPSRVRAAGAENGRAVGTTRP